jgi:para-nitrobenzyl esterase
VTDAPVVRIGQGAVRGTWRDTMRSGAGDGYPRSAAFLGIPFAEAPVGERRFAAPVPAAGWDGVREATEFGPTPQRRPFAEVTAIPEPSFPGDATLNVNVFTPVPGEPEARLPVLVWIHGGGFKAGSPSSPWYDGRAFNRDGVVTVSVSYRLGFDGFGWIPDAPHNRGLLDQIEALRWVRDNIAAFGGDPDRVTIAGQSAGGGSVWALLVSPAAEGLFAAGISQSGALSIQRTDVARRNGAVLARLGGVAWTRAGLSRLSEDDLLDLQEKVGTAPPPRSLEAAVAGILSNGGVRLAFLPYVDGEVLPAGVEESLAAGTVALRPLVMGCTADEFTGAGGMFPPLPGGEDLTAALTRTALASVAAEYVAAYAGLPAGNASVFGKLVSDLTFRVPTVRRADRRGDAPTWLYDFRLVHPDTGLSGHCADVPFAWDCLHAPQVSSSCHPNPPQSLADAMHGAWVAFVRDHRAPWPVWSADGLAMVFDEEPGVRSAYALERRMAEELTS